MTVAHQITIKSILSFSRALGRVTAVFFAALLSNSYSQAASLKEVLNSDVVQKLQEKWEDLELKGQLDLSKDANFGKAGYLAGEIGYKYNVQPALTSGLHQRVDAYFIGASLGAKDLLQLGVKGHVQVSFSKIHLGKKNAILQRPTSIRKFPFSAKEALENMKAGDAARIEISSAAILGAGFFSDLVQSNFIGLKAAYERGNHTFVEVYRLQNNLFRLRFITNKNTGTASAGVTLKPYLDFGLLDNIINGLLSCKPLDIKQTQGVGELPLDTMVADFQIDLNNEEAKSIYDRAFDEISLMDLRNQFISLQRQDDFATGFWSGFGIFDSYYQSQNLLTQEVKPITRTFKSRMLSEQILISKSSGCFKLWDLKGKESHSVSSIRVYDFQDNPKDLFYLRSLNETGQSLIKKDLNAKGQRDFDMLFNAERMNPQDAATIRLGVLTDFVISLEQEERRLTPKEMGGLLADFKYQYPFYNIEIDLKGLLTALQIRDDLNLKLRVAIDPLEIHHVPARSVERYVELLRDYVYNHPVRSMIPTTANLKLPIQIGNSYESDIKKIAVGLAKALNPSANVVDFYKEVRTLRKNKMFQFIGAGFIVSLFPRDVRDRAIQFSYTLEQDDTVMYAFSSNNYYNTENYKNIEGIVSALQDRSFDLKTQIKASNSDFAP